MSDDVNEHQMGMVERGEDALSETGDNSPIEWRGLPRFVPKEKPLSLVLSFDSEEDREQLVEQLGLIIAKRTRGTLSAWWPPREREDLSALRFDFGDL
jgi:hypothetical protein